MNVASFEQRRLFGAHRRSLYRSASPWTPRVERARSVMPAFKASLTIIAWFAIVALCFNSGQKDFESRSLSFLTNPEVHTTSQSSKSKAASSQKITATTSTAATLASTAETAAGTVLPATDAPSSDGPSNAAQFTSSGYSYGHCTYYVAKRRPIPQNWGNARDWLRRSQGAGFMTGNHARPGAIGQTTAGPYGHVVYVEQVADGKVYVSEMNYVAWNVKSYRWADEADFSYIY